MDWNRTTILKRSRQISRRRNNQIINNVEPQKNCRIDLEREYFLLEKLSSSSTRF